MTPPQILLIDDAGDNQFFLTDILSELNSGVQFINVNNGLEAIFHLKNTESLPALIFLDLNMPVINGFECLHWLKNDVQLKAIPVIVFTTSGNPVSEKQALASGAELFFNIHSDLKSLKAKLNDILKSHFSKSQTSANTVFSLQSSNEAPLAFG